MEETQQKIAEPRPMKEDLTKPLLLITVISSLGSLQCGYNLWVIYSPTVLVQDFYNISFGDKYPYIQDTNYNTFLLSITVALFPLGGIFGSFAVGPLSDDHGRKTALLVNSVCATISAVLMGCSRVVKGYEFTMISRFAIGVCSGIFYTAVPIYLSELSPTSLRGSITLTPHFFVVFGVLVAQTLALREILGTQEGWPILMSLVGIPSLCQAIILPTFPESPRYLLIQKKDEEKARTVLKKLRNKEDVEDEIEELRQEDLAEKDEKHMNVLKLLTCPNLRQQAFNVIALACGQQLGGINAAYFYTERIYIATKVGLDNVRFLSILTIAFLILLLSIMLYVISLVERKTVLLVGFTTSSFCCLLLSVAVKYKDTVLGMSYLATIAVNLFLAGHAIGPSSIPNVMTGEMFLQSSRSSAYVIEGFLYWTLYFLTGVTFLQIQAKLENLSFLIFIPFNVAAIIYVLKFLPKTNKKTFLEIRMAAQRIPVREPSEVPEEEPDAAVRFE
ncbi:hypothetical protein lerEdw1_019690 [Lerista edwardsae]|nr:hypothetical protein lerEdw1_019690 [Lerista edwardsae]